MKKPVTKLVALFLLLSLVCFAGMAGCAKTGEDNSVQKNVEESTVPTDEAPTVEPATVRFAEFSAGESNAKTLANMLDLFAEAYPQITVVDESTGYGDYFTELTTQIAGGDAPDVFELNFENFSGFVTRGTVAPLDEMIASHGIDLSVYQQGLLDSVCTVDGKLMALPFSYSTVMLIYNMDLFDAAGLEYPTEDWTWDDVLTAAKAIAKPEEDIWGAYNSMHHIWEFYKRIAQNGGSLFTEDGTAFAINSPQNVETLQWLQDLIWVHHVMPTEEERADRGENELFGSGKLGMFLGGIWTFTDLKERCGDSIRWGVAVEPGNTQKATHVFCNVLCMSSTTDVPDAALTLMKFMTSDPGVAQLRLDAQWELPPLSDPAIMEAYVRNTPPENKQAVLDSTAYGVMPPVMKDFNMLANDIMAPHLEAVRDNIETPQEALDAAQAEATAQIDLSQQ